MTEQDLQSLLAEGKKEEAERAYDAHFTQLGSNSVAKFLWAKNGAILGIPDAIHHVIDAYQKGSGVEPSRVAAFEWLRMAAEKKDSDKSLYYELAMAYYDGHGTVVDVDKFWRWMRAAAKVAGSKEEAMLQLAKAHREPRFGQVSEELAFDWIETMADAGAPRARIDVALAYRDGKGAKKDPTRFLEWADKAVKAARAAIPPRGSHPSNEDWAYDDYPTALSTLADAYVLNKQPIRARSAAKDAAVAATDALDRAQEKKDRILGLTLPEIIRKHLLSYRKRDGIVKLSNQSDYFKWLQKADNAIDQTMQDRASETPLPQELANLIFDLAIAHEEGIGTRPNKNLYNRYLAKAADAKHKVAMYRLAMKYHRSANELAFSNWISQAMDASSNDAFIAKKLHESGLAGAEFHRSRRMLEHLAKVVDEIRSVKHTLKKNARIAHYTDNGALKSMLTLEPGVQKNLLRLYNVAYVNDPNEGRHLLGVTEQSLGRANPLHEFFDEKAGKPVELQGQDFLIFVGSFSLVSDRLDLWRAYGGNGEGFCIETPLAAFPRGPDQPLMGGTWTDKANGWAGSRLFSVCYKRKEAVDTLKRLSAPLDKISAQLKHLSRPGAADAIKGIVVTFLNELLYLYKDEEYEREKEARMIVAKLFDDPSLRRDPRGALERVYLETGGLFFEPEGSRIFIGPKVEKRNEVKIDIRHRLARLKWSHCKVDYSDVPYR